MTTIFSIHAVLSGEIPAPPVPTRVPGRIRAGRIYRGVTIDPLNIMGLIEPQPEQPASIQSMLAGQPSPYDRRRFEDPVAASSSESLIEVTYSAIRVVSYEKDAMANSRPWRVARENRQRTRAERHQRYRLQDAYRHANRLQDLRDDVVRNQTLNVLVRDGVRGNEEEDTSSRYHNGHSTTTVDSAYSSVLFGNGHDTPASRVSNSAASGSSVEAPTLPDLADSTPSATTSPAPVTPDIVREEATASESWLDQGSQQIMGSDVGEMQDIDLEDIPDMSQIPDASQIMDMSMVINNSSPAPERTQASKDARRVRCNWRGQPFHSTDYSDDAAGVVPFYADSDSVGEAPVRRRGAADVPQASDLGEEGVDNDDLADERDAADDELSDQSSYGTELEFGEEDGYTSDETQDGGYCVGVMADFARANIEEDYALSGAESPSSFNIEGSVPDMSDFGSVVGNEEEIVPPQESDENSDDSDDGDDDQPAVGTVADTAQSCGSSVECAEARPAGPKGKVRFADKLEEEVKAATRTAVRMKEMEKEKAAAERCNSVRDRVRQTCAKVRGGLRRMFCLA